MQSIGIRLRYQNSRKCYDLNTLLATLLHEFAHAITRGEMLNGHTEEGRCVGATLQVSENFLNKARVRG